MKTCRHIKHTGLVALLAILVLALMAPTVSLAVEEDEKAIERYEQARKALNAAEYKEAAKLFARARRGAESDKLTAHTLYWEAFARYRLEKKKELKLAAGLLEEALQYAELESQLRREAKSLASRIDGRLAESGDIERIKRIDEDAHDEQAREETRVAALQALMRMNPERARPILVKILRDDQETNQELRRHAVFILCQQEDPEAEDVLLDLLANEEDIEMVGEIIMCLAMHGSERSVDAIIDIAGSSDNDELSEYALYSLSHHDSDRIYDFLISMARDESRSSEIRGQALFALSHTDRDMETAPLLAEVIRTETDSEILEMALMSLAHIDTDLAANALVSLVRNPKRDDELRAQALFFLAQNDGVENLDLVELYRNTDSQELKEQVFHVLTQLDDEDKALDIMIKLAREETDPEILQGVMYWIGQFDDPRAAEFLTEVINQE